MQKGAPKESPRALRPLAEGPGAFLCATWQPLKFDGERELRFCLKLL